MCIFWESFEHQITCWVMYIYLLPSLHPLQDRPLDGFLTLFCCSLHIYNLLNPSVIGWCVSLEVELCHLFLKCARRCWKSHSFLGCSFIKNGKKKPQYVNMCCGKLTASEWEPLNSFILQLHSCSVLCVLQACFESNSSWWLLRFQLVPWSPYGAFEHSASFHKCWSLCWFLLRSSL